MMRMPSNIWKFYVVIVGCVNLFAYNSSRVDADKVIGNQLLSQLPSQNHHGNETGRLKILIWSHPKLRNFIESIGQCSESCEFTFNKQEINSSDAVALSAVFLTGEYPKLPPFPDPLLKRQIRIFFLQEAPTRFYPTYPTVPNDYNWTMTYRLDSQIRYKHGIYVPKEHPDVAPIPDSHLRQLNIPNFSANFFEKYKSLYLKPSRTKSIAWIVSNCKTTGKREELVRELKKYIPVDVYGSCGKLKCDKPHFTPNYLDCYQRLSEQYKFYLAFENAWCHDYVTEKLFLPLNSSMIPIVYGGADYEKFAPPGSYINVDHFSSIKELAEYIQFLDQNDEEYLKYFVWKEFYDLDFRNDFWCELCDKLLQHSVLISKNDSAASDNTQGGDEEKNLIRVIDPSYTSIIPNISQWFYQHPKRSIHHPGSFICTYGGLMDTKFKSKK